MFSLPKKKKNFLFHSSRVIVVVRFVLLVLRKTFFLQNHKSCMLKPLMRNHSFNELNVYYDKKMLFRFRDSLNLLLGKRSALAKNLCLCKALSCKNSRSRIAKDERSWIQFSFIEDKILCRNYDIYIAKIHQKLI